MIKLHNLIMEQYDQNDQRTDESVAELHGPVGSPPSDAAPLRAEPPNFHFEVSKEYALPGPAVMLKAFKDVAVRSPSQCASSLSWQIRQVLARVLFQSDGQQLLCESVLGMYGKPLVVK